VGSYTGWARVDSTCAVTETNEGNNNATAGYVISPQPDLEITSFKTSVAGSSVTFDVTVCNYGTAAAGSFYLDIYHNRASPPSCPTLGQQYATITSLAVGACTSRSFTRTATPAGTYTGWARADAGCSVTELAEGNNNASSSYTVGGLPDLEIAGLSTTVNGADVTFNVSVCNAGNASASNIKLEVYYNRTSAPGCTTAHNQQMTIVSLAPGACTSRVFTRTGTPAGSFTGWARVDADCAIAESSESNNNMSSSYTVVPDLVVQTFSALASGSTVTFSATVCNFGGSTSASFYLDVYYNRVGAPACPTLGDDYVTIAGLDAGACTTRTFTRTNTPLGSYLGWARVDAGCSVSESDEDNNNKSAGYTVASQADLMLQSFTAVVSGTTVTFNVNVCNNGGTAASNVDLELYYHRTSAPGCASVHDQQLTITSLAMGACTTRTFTRTNTPTGAYSGWARVDADCAIAESNENNNHTSASYTVGAQPDLTVQSFKAAVSGTTVTFTATVCNSGGTTTGSFYLDLYYNRVAAPACPTLGDAFKTITGMAAGACATHTFTRSATPIGAYTSWARMDSTCSVSETNENNNNAKASYTVAPVDAGVPSDAGALPDVGAPADGAPHDSGAPVDTGLPPDSVVSPEAGPLPDAGGEPDSGPPPDAGVTADTVPVTPDAGVTQDTGGSSDAVSTGDGAGQPDQGGTGPTPPEEDGGCGCGVASPVGALPPGALLLCLLLFTSARRRRR